MHKYNLLDCTLRDGSYITNGNFSNESIKDIISTLINSNMDFIEVGYLNNTKKYNDNSSHWDSIERIEQFIPEDRKKSILLAMVDVDQFGIDDFVPYNRKSVDGIRIVFYKHQIETALNYAEVVKNMGYKLFMQPMVTIDYSMYEYSSLCEKLLKICPYGISIVDSFGYMTPDDYRKYFKILDNIFPSETVIGVHSHQNMELALPIAADLFKYRTERKIIVDCSLLGMGRGAGNLQTELIANYYNNYFCQKYNIDEILRLVNDHINPIREKRRWGYSPYYFLTAFMKCHPNYAGYLLDNHKLSISEFREYLALVPNEMRTKCRKPYVEELYQKYLKRKM